jgi:hypothetical protein
MDYPGFDCWGIGAGRRLAQSIQLWTARAYDVAIAVSVTTPVPPKSNILDKRHFSVGKIYVQYMISVMFVLR